MSEAAMAKTLTGEQVEYIASVLAEAVKDYESMGWATHRLSDARTAILTSAPSVEPLRVSRWMQRTDRRGLAVAVGKPSDDYIKERELLGYKYEQLYLAPPSSSEPAGVEAWQPIETAPKDGTHIEVTIANKGGFGFCGNPATKQDWFDVVHWHEDGFYSSTFGGEQKEPFKPTHWKPLIAAKCDHVYLRGNMTADRRATCVKCGEFQPYVPSDEMAKALKAMLLPAPPAMQSEGEKS